VVSAETRAKLSVVNSGERSGNWTGDDASYRSVHSYLCRHFPKAGICEECGQEASRTEYALIHGRPMSRGRSDYRELCRPCHMRYDFTGRVFSEEWRAKISASQLRRHRELGNTR
jgi:hypothetical protein